MYISPHRKLDNRIKTTSRSKHSATPRPFFTGSLSPFSTRNQSQHLTSPVHVARLKAVNQHIKDLTIDIPRPASYFITQARARYLNSSKPSTPIELYHPSTPKPQSSKDERPSTCFTVLPEWLNERPDFQSLMKHLNDSSLSPSDINSGVKSDYEKEILFDWLVTVKFFSKLPRQIVKEVCEKLTKVEFEKGDVIIRKGDTAECMFLVHKGKADVFIDDGIVHAFVLPNDVVGEHALDTQRHRSATVVCTEAMVAMKLTKFDYDCIILNNKKAEKSKTCSLLASIPYFHSWTPLKIQHFSNYLIKKTFADQNIIFDKGDESNTYYIIKSGKVDIQAHVSHQVNYRWPTGVKSWKISEVNRKYLKTVCSLSKGQYFGENDLITRDHRKFRAVSNGKVICLTVDKDEFFEIFSSKDIDNLQKFGFVDIPKDQELEKMLENEIRDKEMNVKSM